MLVKDVLGECLAKMGREDFLSESSLSDEDAKLRDRLLAALNIAYREAVTEFIPLYHEEEVTVSEGEADPSALSKRILYPVTLSFAGERHKVWIRAGRLRSDRDGKGTLRYAYLPEELPLDGEIEDMRVTPSALSDGTLAEFYLADKVFDLAEAYDASFRDAMRAVRYKGRPLRLGAGRWSE